MYSDSDFYEPHVTQVCDASSLDRAPSSLLSREGHRAARSELEDN
jgi:hypothetical protein